jgi:hypothetical protein
MSLKMALFPLSAELEVVDKAKNLNLRMTPNLAAVPVD